MMPLAQKIHYMRRQTPNFQFFNFPNNSHKINIFELDFSNVSEAITSEECLLEGVRSPCICVVGIPWASDHKCEDQFYNLSSNKIHLHLE